MLDYEWRQFASTLLYMGCLLWLQSSLLPVLRNGYSRKLADFDQAPISTGIEDTQLPQGFLEPGSRYP